MLEQWRQLCHPKALTLTGGGKCFVVASKPGREKINVTVTRSVVCASVSITIGSSLCVAGIMLFTTASPRRINASVAAFSGQFIVFFVYLSLLFTFFIFSSHLVSTYLVSWSLPWCLLVNIYLFVSLYFHPFISISYSLTKTLWKDVNAESITILRKHYLDTQCLFFLARSAVIVICGLLSNVCQRCPEIHTWMRKKHTQFPSAFPASPATQGWP